MSERIHPVYEIAEYVAANEPDTPQYGKVRQHLSQCRACRDLMAQLRHTEVALRTLPVEAASQALMPQVVSIVSRRQVALPEWSFMPWTVWVPAASVITASMMLLLLLPSETPVLRNLADVTAPILKPEILNSWLVSFRLHFTHNTLVTVGSAAAAILGGAGFVWALASLSPEQNEKLDNLGEQVADRATHWLHLRRSG